MFYYCLTVKVCRKGIGSAKWHLFENENELIEDINIINVLKADDHTRLFQHLIYTISLRFWNFITSKHMSNLYWRIEHLSV
jgi:hypothetical protein